MKTKIQWIAGASVAVLAVLCFFVLPGRKDNSPGHAAKEITSPIVSDPTEETRVAPETKTDHLIHDNFAAKYKHFLGQFNAATNKDITSAYWVSSLSDEDLREMAWLWINGELGKLPSPLREMAFKELGRRLGSETVSLLEASHEIDTLDRESLRAFAEGFASTDVDKASLMARTTLNQTLRYRLADGVTAWALTLPMEEGIRYVEGIQDLVQTPAAFASGVASVWLAADTAQETFGKLTRLASGNFDPVIIGGFHGTGVATQIYKDSLAAIKEMKTYAWPSQDIESRVWMGSRDGYFDIRPSRIA